MVSKSARCFRAGVAIATVAAALLAPSPSHAQRVTPIEATVLVRLIGDIRVLRGEDERAWRERLLDLRGIPVGIGSGFVISPEGWVVTNHHVISGERSIIIVQGQKLEVSVDVSAVEVVLPAGPGRSANRYAASVHVVDTELDLAILRVAATDLPYVGLGDSDALIAGQSAQAVGYPFGGTLDLGTADAAASAASPSITTGAVSALRYDSSGERRYLQVSTVLNPGNSGGPIADAEGYAVGVAQARLENAAAIGVAIPINRVKQLLRRHGLESLLPVTLLEPGGSISSATKGLRMATPAGFDDRSETRLRVEAALGLRSSRIADPADETLALRIDRLASSANIVQIERALMTDGVFERFQPSSAALPSSVATPAARMRLGYANGADPETAARMKLVYAILDLGREKIVARYSGSADTVAANRSLLELSLAQLAATPLLTAEIARTAAVAWVPPSSREAAGDLPAIQGWVREPGVPWRCGVGLPDPLSGFTMSPSGDFTVALRAAWHATPAVDVNAAARGCSPQPGAFGPGSYGTQATAWGVDYHITGVFVPVPGSGVWQLEMVVPAEKRRFVADVFATWVTSLAR